VRQHQQLCGVRRVRLVVLCLGGVFAPGAHVGFPAGAALGEDARQQRGGGLGVGMGGAPCLGELAFDGDFEHGGAVALEGGLGAFEGGDAGIEARELLLDGFEDAALLGEGRERNVNGLHIIEAKSHLCSASSHFIELALAMTLGGKKPRQVSGCILQNRSSKGEVLIDVGLTEATWYERNHAQLCGNGDEDVALPYERALSLGTVRRLNALN
jgi:hypothetical protein